MRLFHNLHYPVRGVLETTRYVSMLHVYDLLLGNRNKQDQQSNDQCVNSDSFCEHD